MRQVDFIAHRQDGAASNFGVLHELRVKLDMFNGKACDRIDATQTARPCVDSVVYIPTRRLRYRRFSGFQTSGSRCPQGWRLYEKRLR